MPGVGGKTNRHSGEFPSCAYRCDCDHPANPTSSRPDIPGFCIQSTVSSSTRLFSRGPQSSGLRRHPQVPIRIPGYRLPVPPHILCGPARRSGKHGASLSKSPALQGWGYLRSWRFCPCSCVTVRLALIQWEHTVNRTGSSPWRLPAGGSETVAVRSALRTGWPTAEDRTTYLSTSSSRRRCV